MSDGKIQARRIKPWVIKAAIVFPVILSIAIPVGWGALRRAQCCAASLVSSSFMRQILTEHSIDVSEGEPLRHVGLMVVDGIGGDGMFSSHCYCDTLSETIILGHTLKEIRSKKLDSAALRSDLPALVDSEAWEQLGRFWFSREAIPRATYDARIILGLSCYENSGVQVGFADVHVESIYSRSELLQLLELDREAREASDLPALPIDILQEIDKYRAGKKLDPFSD